MSRRRLKRIKRGGYDSEAHRKFLDSVPLPEREHFEAISSSKNPDVIITRIEYYQSVIVKNRETIANNEVQIKELNKPPVQGHRITEARKLRQENEVLGEQIDRHKELVAGLRIKLQELGSCTEIEIQRESSKASQGDLFNDYEAVSDK